jgi:hypothetical protein
MDSKITLNIDKDITNKAKDYAAQNNVSLSNLVEFLLHKVTSSGSDAIEDFPVADWVSEIAEGKAAYQTKSRSRKDLKNEYFSATK